MLRSLVGSEMCIRDRVSTQSTGEVFGLRMAVRQTAIGAACWVPVAIAFHDHCFAIRTVNSAAMQPSLQPGEMVAEGPPDRVLLDKISARKNWLYRGDAVIMSSPVSPGSSYATRIVGLEGDWVQPSTRQGLVHVPKGHCWVQHDNMENDQSDSNDFGPVALALVSARVSGVVWPYARISRAHDPNISSDRIVIFSHSSSP
eukprot:TRINITY_DN1701_c0_g1_i7.p1 TRINITY_DN1701_c0_g1~~TRINITY_DN1701_c0_g1_i7.p1  ORF type:complete len:233 (-),score=45.96 TRINITY_DN1701_c0_g1_i7:491-1093(-)